MEDDKKNAMTEEVVEIVQQEAELPSENTDTDPPESFESDTQEEVIGESVQDDPPEANEVLEALQEETSDSASDIPEELASELPTDQNQNSELEEPAIAEVETESISASEESPEQTKEIDSSQFESGDDTESLEQEEIPLAEDQSLEKFELEDTGVVDEQSSDTGDLDENMVEANEVKDTLENGIGDDVGEEEVETASETNENQVEEVAEPTSEGADSNDSKENNKKNSPAVENDFESVDLTGTSKVEQLDLLKKMLGEENIRKIDTLFKNLGAHYDSRFDGEKKEALDAFLKVEGSDEADFEFKGDDTDQEFHSLYEKLRRKRAQFFQEVGKEKDNNLIKKNEILVLLREIIDGENQESFDKVKKLQQEWKSVGQVPGSQNNSLWASYHALMDRFYDHRSIYFELKELDRKKNLDAKLEICKKAETLDASTNVTHAITQLNELHEEFKHIGPVPREDQEGLWQRFKAASDQVYEKRNEFNEHQKVEFKANLDKKLEFVERAKALVEFDSDRIKHWNGKTKELLELQKEWEAVGGMPRQSAKQVNKAFWGSYKKFYANKSKFFKKLDAQRDENLAKKKELIEAALQLREGKDWETTANALKKLQSQWQEIGPVPDKYRKSLYEEFNEHCNHFFERKRGQNAEQNKEFEQNLEKKKSILSELQAMTNGEGFDLDKAFDLLDNFSGAGLVPRNAVGKTLEKYDKVCKQLLALDSLSESDVNELRVHIQMSKIRNSPHGNQKINRKEGMLKRKIDGLENDIYNWKRNIDFFGRSANAEAMKKEFQERIDTAENDLRNMKQELRLVQH